MSTQRHSALGTLCRRPSALLIPLAPLVLLVFVVLTIVAPVRAAVIRRRPTADAALHLETAVDATRVSRIRVSPVRTVGAAAGLLAAILLAATTAGGTYAFLNSQAKPASGITINSGNLALTVQATGTTAGTTTMIPTAAWTNMLPGDFVGQQVTVVNTGSATVNATARLSAATPWDIRMVVGTCPTTQITSSPLTTSAAGYGSLAPGASAVVCVQATLPTTASSSVEATSANFSIVIDSVQA